MQQFFLSNPEIELQIKSIRRQLRLRMNGEVSASMREKGLHYKVNWGASLMHIKEIAKEYEPNQDLASRLWAMKHRETMIMASLLYPIEQFDDKQFGVWLNDVNNIELVEQLSMNLLAKHSSAKKWSKDLIVSEDEWHQVLGFTLITRSYNQYNLEEIDDAIDRAVELAKTENYFLYRSIATALSRFGRNGADFVAKLKEKIEALKANPSHSVEYILNEINFEISFLED